MKTVLVVNLPRTGAAGEDHGGLSHEWWRLPGAEVVCNTGTLVYFAGSNVNLWLTNHPSET